MSDWEPMDPHAVRVAGILYAINKFILWPIGMALAVDYETDVLVMLMLGKPETITEGRIDASKEPGGCHPSERFNRFAADRVTQMPDMEREMATRALQKLFPGFGISPVRDGDE